jgi:sugar phosphate isomerase/epimerase
LVERRQLCAARDLRCHRLHGNNDPIAFIREHHTCISHLHLKDRKRDNGQNLPWGTADTPNR